MLTSRKLGAALFLALQWVLPGQLQMILSEKSIEVTRGKQVMLEASYKPTQSIEKNVVIWNFNSSKQVISYTKEGSSKGDAHFVNRVQFLNSMPSSNLSISINNTMEYDSGRYVCQVVIPNATGLVGEIVLTVNVPPSVPQCQMSGKAVLKGNVTLSCNSKEGKPLPVYHWKRAPPRSTVFFPPLQDEKQGTLKLNNLSSDMSGTYICTVSNTVGSETCSIELNVSTATNAGVIAGAIVGAVLGLLAIILFLVFILRRKKDSEDDMANDIKEDAQAPKRVSWAKSGTGSDIISKNGTLSSITSSPRPQNHLQNYHYPQQAISDTASIMTTTGSTAGYRPRPGEASPAAHTVRGYNTNTTLPRGSPGPPSSNGNSFHRMERSQPRPPQPPTVPTVPIVPIVPTVTTGPAVPTGVTAANISRMGGVPIMVPAQNQAGSLV
ncbi:endothelial cell-selective adhesion molecule [Arapaima gigas]